MNRVTGIQPVRLTYGSLVYISAALAPSMHLQEALRLAEHGEVRRQAALASLEPDGTGYSRVRDKAAELDRISAIGASILLSFAAVEAYANELMVRLPDDATVPVERNDTVRNIAKRNAVDIGIGEKVRFVVPRVTGNQVWGTPAWDQFADLRRLRDEVTHLRDRGVSNDPDMPTVLGRIFRGDGANAPQEAAAVIEAAEPGWIWGDLRVPLGLP